MNFWDTFWNAASAIATTAAVIVALWQTKYANRKKLKVKFIEKMTIVPQNAIGKIPKNQYVGLDIINIENRKVIINQVWIQLPENMRAVIQPDIIPGLNFTFPLELDVEQSTFFPWCANKFLDYIKSEKKFLKNQRLIFCISDTTGVIYKCKTPKTIGEYISQQTKSKE